MPTRSRVLPGPYGIITSAPTELRASALAVYMAIRWLMVVNRGMACIAPIDGIAARAGVGKVGTRRALKWLIANGWVERQDVSGYMPVFYAFDAPPTP